MNRRVCSLATSEIKETPENWEIYRKPDDGDDAWIELCESVRDGGINTPLEVSRDRYVISGHRRLRAAIHNNLENVPVIFDWSLDIGPMDQTERLKLLIERNRGTREKSDTEKFLEVFAQVDPEEAVRTAQARKANVFTSVKTLNLHEVAATTGIRRTDPQGKRSELLSAVLSVIEELREGGYLPTGSRNIHYSLLKMKVLTSSTKAGHIYGTVATDCKLLSKLITDARSAGLIDPEDINDGTRPFYSAEPDGPIAGYVLEGISSVFQNYRSHLHRDQVNHIEILVEKNTIAPLIYKHVGNVFRVPVTSMRGYGSFPVSRDIANRFKRSGKENLFVIYVSDLDPEGVDMPAAFKKYLLHDFGVEANVIRASVTLEQVEEYNLPPDIEVKVDGVRAPAFLKKYGNQCWELDSVPPKTLVYEVKRAVQGCMDIQLFNDALEAERALDVDMARMGAAVNSFITEHFQNMLEEAGK